LRILLVEDEVRLTDALAHIFRQNNFSVDVANDGEEGWTLAQQEIYDAIVLDIMLPVKSGLEILRGLRQKGISTPVLLLTARDTVEDRVKGLDYGADDYLIKPFATDELLARVRALCRRPPAVYTREKLAYGNILLDVRDASLQIGRESLRLSAKELALLELLIRRPGQVLTKNQILDHVWGYDADITENSIEIYVHHLRKKMKAANVQIVTYRGLGYALKEK